MKALALSGSTLPSKNDEIALRSLRGWVDRLQSSDERITPMVKAKLPAALRAADAYLQPCPVKQFMVEIDDLADWARAFNIPQLDIAAATKFYRESLGHLPADLLRVAFKNIKASHRYGMRLPLPAEIIAGISDDIHKRRQLRAKLELAMRCPVESPDDVQPSPDEIERVQAILAQARASRPPEDRKGPLPLTPEQIEREQRMKERYQAQRRALEAEERADGP